MPRVWNMRDPSRPKDATYVGRPTKYGNQWSHMPDTRASIVVPTVEDAIAKHKEWIMARPELVEEAKRELRGKDLTCWCVGFGSYRGHGCHAETLLEIANG